MEAVNYYHKALHLGYCSSPRSSDEAKVEQIILLLQPSRFLFLFFTFLLFLRKLYTLYISSNYFCYEKLIKIDGWCYKYDYKISIWTSKTKKKTKQNQRILFEEVQKFSVDPSLTCCLTYMNSFLISNFSLFL